MARQTGVKTITLLDDVEKCEKDIVEALLEIPDGKPVRIVINSGGGSVYASLGIATVLRMKKLQSEAVVLADCSSSALIVFSACARRLIAPHASFLFHPMRWSSEDQARLQGAKSWSSEFSRVTEVCENWLIENLPISRRTLRQWMREERYIEAAELIELGVAEELDLSEEGVIDIAAGTRKKSRRRTIAARSAARVRRVG